MSLKSAWKTDPYVVVGALATLIAFGAALINWTFGLPQFLTNSAAMLMFGAGVILIVGNFAIGKLISSPRGKIPPPGALLLNLIGIVAIIVAIYMFMNKPIPLIIQGIGYLVGIVVIIKVTFDLTD